MKSVFGLLTAGVSSVLLLTGCGDITLGKKVQVHLNAATQVAQVEIQMGDGLEMNMISGKLPIADGKGSIYFVPATKTENGKIGVEVDLKQLAGELNGVGTITNLPNGAPLPVAMTPPLISVPVLKNESYQVTAALSVIPELQLGALVGLKKLSSKFALPGFALCQNFRNKEGVAIAAICAFGPGTKQSGGLFVGANFGQVFKQNQTGSEELVADGRAFLVSAPEASALTFVGDDIRYNSDDWAYSIHDPSGKLMGKDGEKTLRNFQKALR